MDPGATLRTLIDAVCRSDWQEADEALDALKGWSARRGYQPFNPLPERMGAAR